MKIGMISGYDPTGSEYGGAEISFYILAKALASLGVEVHLITEPLFRNQKGVEETDGIHIHRVLYRLRQLTFSGGGIFSVMLSSKTVADSILKIHNKENFDLIHACNRNTAVGTVIASKRLAIPCILHVRDYWPFCPTTSLQRYYTDSKCGKLSPYCIYCHFQDFKDAYGSVRTLLWAVYAYFQTMVRKIYARKASHIVAISEFVKNILVKNGFDKEKITVVPNPVELIDRPQVEHKLEDKKVVLFVGRLSVYKGVFDVLKAVKIVHEAGKMNVELRIIGDGFEEEALRRYVRNNHMEYVEIVGRIPHSKVLEEYCKADVVVLPFKRPEPFGRVIVEAMAAGVPVVSYAAGAIPEIITHRKTGVLVELSKVRMFAKSIMTLLEEEKLRKAIGERSRKAAREKYEPEEVARKMIAIYEDVLSAKPIANVNRDG